MATPAETDRTRPRDHPPGAPPRGTLDPIDVRFITPRLHLEHARGGEGTPWTRHTSFRLAREDEP